MILAQKQSQRAPNTKITGYEKSIFFIGNDDDRCGDVGMLIACEKFGK